MVSLNYCGTLQSDRVGRKPVVLFGLSLACLASFAASSAQAIVPFLVLRFLQGVGSGVCWGIGRIIAADVMQDERLAAIGSYFTLFLSLSPLLAPALGGYIQHWFGWQVNFIVLGGIVFLVLLLFIFYFDETNLNKRENAFVLKNLISTYGSFFRHRLFMGSTLLTGVVMSANIIYMTISSFIFQQQFHTSPIIFGWLTAVVGLASVVGKLVSPFVIIRLRNQKTTLVGAVLLLIRGVFLTFFGVIKFMSIPVVLFGVAIAFFSFAMVSSTTMAMALSPFHDKRGSAGGFTWFFSVANFFCF